MKYISVLKAATRRASLLISVISFSLLFSCDEDPTFLGRDLLPPADNFNTFYFEGEEIISFSSLADTMNTSISYYLLLGSYSDDVFGRNVCEIGVRPEISNREIVGDIQIDSMVLSLYFDKVFSDTLVSPAPQMIRVYEMLDSTSAVQPFYSNFSFEGKYNPIELGSGMVTPRLDSGFSVSFHIESESLVDRFENLPDSIFTDINDFVSNFNAFYITTDELFENESVMFLDYNSTRTNFKAYFTETSDTTVTNSYFLMSMGILTQGINSFSYNPEGTRANVSLTDNFASDTLMFLSSMGGMSTKINFPEIEQWLHTDSSSIAINSAKLILPINKSGLSDPYFQPEKLILLSYRDELPAAAIEEGLGPYEQIYDDLVDSDGNYFGGFYDEEEEAYIFNIGLHLQNFVNGESPNMDMVLIPSSSAESGSRVVLNSPLHPDNPVKLKIIYTKF